MKNSIKLAFWSLMTLWGIAACSPQDNDDHSLGGIDTITSEEVSFNQQVSTSSANVLTFTNTSDAKVPYSVSWDLGNGTTGKADSIVGSYPFAGDYTVTLTLYTASGVAASTSQVIHIENSDYGLINTPVYTNLTGGIADTDGKIWVFDQYNNFAKEVADATGYEVKGHIGLGPQDSYGQNWWGAGVDEKSGGTMYSFEFTFVQSGAKLMIKNEGSGYGRNASAASVGGFHVTAVDGDDATFDYSGGNYTFAIDESGKYPKMTLSGNAFMGYYCGTQDYEIFYQTDKVMALRANNTVEGQDWVYVFCLKELNINTPKELKAIPLEETFEEATPTVVFEGENMGEKTGICDNPIFSGNTSDKVYRYQKSTSPSSNLFYVASDYKFDLTKQNKISMKVMMPGYNDYVTENGKESWATSAKLLPKVVVKLYDSSSSEPWNSATEKSVTLTSDQLDKWVDVSFDFSDVASRKDYDKIVIQFGQEGHYGEGIFYFDDFKFSE